MKIINSFIILISTISITYSYINDIVFHSVGFWEIDDIDSTQIRDLSP